MLEPGFVLTVSLAALTAVVWLVRLEGRVNVTDVRYEDILRRLDAIDKKLE